MIEGMAAFSNMSRVKHVVSKIGSGKTPSGGSETYLKEGVTFLRSQNIHFGGLKLEDVAYISYATHREMGNTAVAEDDILLNITGASLGRAARFPAGMGEANVNQHVCILRPTDSIDPRFFEYAMSTHTTWMQIFSLQVGGNRDGLNFEQVGNLRIPLPDRGEQQRIANFLDAETARIDQIVDLRKRQSTNLAERYAAAISEITTPGISTSRDRNTKWPWLPDSLKTSRLGHWARVQSGITIHSARTRSAGDAEFPYLRVANVQGERIDLSDVKTITIPVSMAKRSMLEPGDVVMTEANGNPDNLGRGAVWYGEIADMVHQNHVFAIRVDRHRLMPEYISALLASSHGRHYFRFTSTQVGIATTSSSKVLDFPIPLVPVAEQAQIVKECDRLRSWVRRVNEALDRQIDLLLEHRQALITSAVTGQFDASSASGYKMEE